MGATSNFGAVSALLFFSAALAAQKAEKVPLLYQPSLEWAAPSGWITSVQTTLIANPPYPENRVLIDLWVGLSDFEK